MVVADYDFLGGLAPWLALLERLEHAAAAHDCILQARARSLSPPRLAAAARAARRRIRHAPLLLNGPPALAAHLGYDGCHAPESTLEQLASAPRGSLPLRSAAVHSLAAARRAEAAGANALVFSPVFSPRWKPARAAGTQALRQVAEATALPVYALGGVTPPAVHLCRNAGAWGIAVLSGICAAPDPAAALARYAAAAASGPDSMA